MRHWINGLLKFISFLLIPQQGKHITEQAQSYSELNERK